MGLGERAREERGAAAVEYGLLAALIAAVIVVIVKVLGSKVSNDFQSATGGVAVGSTDPTADGTLRPAESAHASEEAREAHEDTRIRGDGGDCAGRARYGRRLPVRARGQAGEPRCCDQRAGPG